jgi:hypothetical protein
MAHGALDNHGTTLDNAHQTPRPKVGVGAINGEDFANDTGGTPKGHEAPVRSGIQADVLKHPQYAVDGRGQTEPIVTTPTQH